MSERAYQFAYLAALAGAVVLNAVLVSDLGVLFQLSPHDDSLYVSRAFSLLNGQAFGPYDSHTLSKLPGISLWLAGTRVAGIPHLIALNALYVFSGLYLIAGMRRAGAARTSCICSIRSPGVSTGIARSASRSAREFSCSCWRRCCICWLQALCERVSGRMYFR